MQASLIPIFIKGNVRFALLGREFNFPSEDVSPFGVSGLRLNNANPEDLVGTAVNASIEIMASRRFVFYSDSRITSEATVDAVYMGLSFSLREEIKRRLIQAIQKEGYYPTSYMRKYPRIPASENIPTMPLRAILSSTMTESIAFDIANMSPNGVLLYTENPAANVLLPGMRITVQIEPRGMPVRATHFDGMICRVMQNVNVQNNNIRRYLGIRMLRLSADDRQNFRDTLKAVLTHIANAQ